MQDTDLFKAIALAWVKEKAIDWTPAYCTLIKQRLNKHVFPVIGEALIKDVQSEDIDKIHRTAKARVSANLGGRIVTICSQVFQYAIVKGVTNTDPAAKLRASLKHKK